MLNIALFGPPGAGKGTQAKKIVEKYNLAHLSTGEMIRKEIAEGSDFGKMAAGIINKGELLSDEFVVALIENSIEHHKNVDGFLFDGFPRTVRQAEILDEMLAKTGHPLSALVSIDVPHDELMRRMLEQGDLKVYEIAEKLGYESAFYFSKVFKKVTGLSPREYQQSI